MRCDIFFKKRAYYDRARESFFAIGGERAYAKEKAFECTVFLDFVFLLLIFGEF
jgi:hypothetical protein